MRAALRTFKDVLIPNGRVLIFVPAVQAAYGPLDAELGHHRRYSKPTLAKAFRDAGLDLLTLRYTNPIGLLGWMYNAHISKSTAHSLTQVKLFETLVAPWALPLERPDLAADRLVADRVGRGRWSRRVRRPASTTATYTETIADAMRNRCLARGASA